MPTDLNQTGVYLIRNTVNGKLYVGSTTESFLQRWGTHRRQLADGKHHSRYLQRAWDKYGEMAFEFQILEFCSPVNCVEIEQQHMDALKSASGSHGYNVSPTAGNSLGVVRTPENRANISKGKQNISAETRARIGAKSKGRIQSAEQRAKNSAANKGKVVSPETRQKIAETLRGKKHSPERRTKNIAAQRLRARLRKDAGYRKVLSPETRAIISAAKQGKKTNRKPTIKCQTTSTTFLTPLSPNRRSLMQKTFWSDQSQ